MWAKLSEAERKQIYGEYGQFSQQVKASGHYLTGAQLQPTATATSVRVRDGKRLRDRRSVRGDARAARRLLPGSRPRFGRGAVGSLKKFPRRGSARSEVRPPGRGAGGRPCRDVKKENNRRPCLSGAAELLAPCAEYCRTASPHHGAVDDEDDQRPRDVIQAGALGQHRARDRHEVADRVELRRRSAPMAPCCRSA